MTPRTITEKAIEGGWKQDYYVGKELNSNEIKEVADIHLEHYGIYQVLLDPKFWQAVGKVEGWSRGGDFSIKNGDIPEYGNWVIGSWGWYMHYMVDALADASDKPDFSVQKTIEEYLKTL